MVQRKSKLRWIPKIDPNAEIEDLKLKTQEVPKENAPNDENRPPDNNIEMPSVNHQEPKLTNTPLVVQEGLKLKENDKEERKEEDVQKASPQVRFVKVLKHQNSEVGDIETKPTEDGEKAESKPRVEDQMKDDLEKMLEENSQVTSKGSSEKQSSSSSQKKRGRPKKNPLPKKDEPEKSDPVKPDKENLLEETLPVEAQVEEPKQMQVESQEVEKIEVEVEIENEAILVTPPRKRGRPKKSKASEPSSNGKESSEGMKTEILIDNPGKIAEEKPEVSPIQSPKPSTKSPKSTESPKSSSENPKPKKRRGRPPKKEKMKKKVTEKEISESEDLNQKRERPESIEKESEETIEDQAYPAKKVKTMSSSKITIKLTPKVKTSNEKICKDNEDELITNESTEANKSTETEETEKSKESVQLSPKVTEGKKASAKRRGRPGRPKKVSK